MEVHGLQTITIALVVGIFSYVLARRLKVPAVLFYLFGGIASGPVGVGVIDSSSLGTGLITLVELAMAVILFEGGLSLSTHSFRSEASGIKRILVIALPLTGLGAALLCRYMLNISWQFSIFFGAVIVVTGPTVIGSLLRSVNLTRRLEILLSWESIWGDVLGVLLSALALKIIDIDFASAPPHNLVILFFSRIAAGAAIGAISGYIMARFILPTVVKLRDPGLPGVVAVACALGTFFLSDSVLTHTGPLAAVVAGYFLSHLKADTLHDIRHFKDQLSSIFISTLFVLLSAHINPLRLAHLWPKMLLAAVILGAFVRPTAVFAALAGTTTTLRERVFVGLIGPRGIIAIATMSYGSFLVQGHAQEMEVLLCLTFAVIFFSGATATIICRPLSRLLGVMVPVSESGILLVGANTLSSGIADFVARYVPTAVLDNSTSSCSLSDVLGAETVCADLLETDLYQDASAEGFGRMLAVTTSDSMNALIARKASAFLPPQNIFRVPATRRTETMLAADEPQDNIVFSTSFYISEALHLLESDKAELRVLEPDKAGASRNIVPLVQLDDKGTGVLIVRPGQEVTRPALCFIPKN